MDIVGIQKYSTIDYPDKDCITVFLKGCNLKCRFCHNPIALDETSSSCLSFDSFFEILRKRENIIDAVCISGGEPTIHKSLIDFISEIKKYNYLVKLDTNGSNPDVIKDVLDNRLVDYIAVDIKAPLYKYCKVVNTIIDVNNILRTVELVKRSSINYEFRTTFIPELNRKDILLIAGMLKGSQRYVLQKYINDITLDEMYKNLKPYSDEVILRIVDEIRPFFKECFARLYNNTAAINDNFECISQQNNCRLQNI